MDDFCCFWMCIKGSIGYLKMLEMVIRIFKYVVRIMIVLFYVGFCFSNICIVYFENDIKEV